MTRKYINKKCTLSVEKNDVTLLLEIEGKTKEIFVVPNINEPRAPYPLPDMEQLIKNARYFSKRGAGGDTIKGFLETYIRGREDDIKEQIIEIWKSMKRIDKALQCIDMVKEKLKSI
jgi:hypothetical protein